MAWIELHQTLPRHPKLIRLAAKLRIPRAQAAGHLTFLWLWTLDYAPTGDLSAFGPAEISAAADFSGDPEAFAAALRETEWMDRDGHVHDWEEYAGRLVSARERNKARMRDARAKHVQRTSETRVELCLATVPNPTVPEESVCIAREPESLPVASRSAGESGGTSGSVMIPPLSRADFDSMAAVHGVPAEVAEWVWNTHDARGWTDTHGQPIRNVAAVLRGAKVRHEERRSKETALEASKRIPAPSTPHVTHSQKWTPGKDSAIP